VRHRTGYPYGKKPWLKRDSCVHFQRTVVGDHVDVIVVLTVVLVGLAVVALALLAR
jgi:hypothetical protein